VYWGSGEIGVPTLKMLATETSEFELVAVVTREDAPAGRKMLLCCTPIKRFLLDELVDRIVPVRLNHDDATQSLPASGRVALATPSIVKGNKPLRAFLKALEADAFVVASYGQILTNLILDKAKWAVCVHTSALPRLRGPSPVRTALILGHTSTQICTFLMTPRMDDGDVLARRDVEIDENAAFSELCARFSNLMPELTRESLLSLASGSARPEPQDHALASYTRLITKADAWIDWSLNATAIRNLCRALSPDMCIVTSFKGKRIKFDLPLDAVMIESGEPHGAIVQSDDDAGYIDIACGEGTLRVRSVQPESRPWISAADFIHGFAPVRGDRFDAPTELTAGRPPFESATKFTPSASES
jgi:methionyl-tRNA formyltransferase